MRIQPRTQGWRIWCVQTAGLGILTCFTSCWTDTKIPAVNSSQALKKDRSIIPEPASPCLQDLVGDSFKKPENPVKTSSTFPDPWRVSSPPAQPSVSSALCQGCWGKFCPPTRSAAASSLSNWKIVLSLSFWHAQTLLFFSSELSSWQESFQDYLLQTQVPATYRKSSIWIGFLWLLI